MRCCASRPTWWKGWTARRLGCRLGAILRRRRQQVPPTSSSSPQRRANAYTSAPNPDCRSINAYEPIHARFHASSLRIPPHWVLPACDAIVRLHTPLHRTRGEGAQTQTSRIAYCSTRIGSLSVFSYSAAGMIASVLLHPGPAEPR